MPKYSKNFGFQSHLPSSLERHLYLIMHQSDLTHDLQADVNGSEQPIQSSWLSRLWNAIKLAFESRHEPTFWQKCDRHGNLYWEGYDPVSDRTLYFESDKEALIWLDQQSYLR